jgi:hypothetical protein
VQNPETGEMEWHPAEGGDAVTAGDWADGTVPADEALTAVAEPGGVGGASGTVGAAVPQGPDGGS